MAKVEIELKDGTIIRANPGEYVRFDPYGRFLAVLSYRTNGLGIDYLVQENGQCVRSIF